MDLARHGATPAGGVNRQALSMEEIAARRTLLQWAAGLDLRAGTDDAGNFFLRMEGSEPRAAAVLTGSHIDSQPTGGKFDGAYGVLAGLECLQAFRESGVRPRRSIEVVAWMNEEGSRFAPGMMGSSVFSGARTLPEILEVRDRQGITVRSALTTMQEAFPDLPRWELQRPLHAYVEAHIEQGPLLERHRRNIGVVTGIQGKRTFEVTVTGEQAHAGTAPRAERKDALLGALRAIDALCELCRDEADLARFTVGRMDLLPNAPSVVPARATFSIDLRHPDSCVLRELGDRIQAVCEHHAEPCGVRVRELSTSMSLEFPLAARELIEASARRLGIPSMEILSCAGHDARYLHEVCMAGMIFVPCKGGISHNEAESVEPGELADGARVLAETLWTLASQA
jgi:N-carbamoyl-L-amino-acid hydrolase